MLYCNEGNKKSALARCDDLVFSDHSTGFRITDQTDGSVKVIPDRTEKNKSSPDVGGNRS